MHKNSSAGRSGGIFNTETLVVTCLDSSVAHSCRFLRLFGQVGQAVMEMLTQNAAAFFPLCALEKKLHFLPLNVPACTADTGRCAPGVGRVCPIKSDMRISNKSMSSTYTFAHTHNVDGYIGKNTREEGKRKLIQNEKAAAKVQYLHVQNENATTINTWSCPPEVP